MSQITIEEANRIVRAYYKKLNPTASDDFIFIEALEFIISETNNPEYMMALGGYYYGRRQFDLARRYYEMASAYGIDSADECLGYIWYYGRTGERDYQRAFEHYSKSMERGNPVSTYKVADMYKNGYYVEKDYDKYVSIIEALYPKVKNESNLGAPVPEVFTRLAHIRREQGRADEAIDLYIDAKYFLADRILYDDFFGNLNIMKWLIDDLYEIKEFDRIDFDFYDLYYLLKRPVRVSFKYGRTSEIVEALEEDGGIAIKFNDKWYRDRDDFFKKAAIGKERLTSIYYRLEDFSIASP